MGLFQVGTAILRVPMEQTSMPYTKAILCAAAVAALAAAAASPADAQSRRRDARAQAGNQSSETDRLNDLSLQRARQGTDSPSPGPDTTSNLNRMSEEDARMGRNPPRPAPMPFR
jgi:hypothetical protein